MSYEVVWLAPAEEELAALWLAGSDRKAITQAANYLEQALAIRPLTFGESRTSATVRIGFHPPLGIEYIVIEDDKRVVIQAVFEVN